MAGSVFVQLLLQLVFGWMVLGNGYHGNGYNPYNPNYGHPLPYPPYPPIQPPVNPQRGNDPVAFALSRATKNNQCLNLRMCFIQFDNELTSVNAKTYPSYGAFQAVVGGIYFFTFTIALSGTAQQHPRLSLRRNNEVIVAANMSGQPAGSTEHMPVTYSIVLGLQPQDAVYIIVESGEIVESSSRIDAPLNSFSGFLIAPMLINNVTNSGAPGNPGFNQNSGAGLPGSPGAMGNNFNNNNVGNNFGNPGLPANSFPANNGNNRNPFTGMPGMPPFYLGRAGSINNDENANNITQPDEL